jgi:hypothetical protein
MKPSRVRPLGIALATDAVDNTLKDSIEVRKIRLVWRETLRRRGWVEGFKKREITPYPRYSRGFFPLQRCEHWAHNGRMLMGKPLVETGENIGWPAGWSHLTAEIHQIFAHRLLLNSITQPCSCYWNLRKEILKGNLI